LTEAVNLLDADGWPKLTREEAYLAKHQNVQLPFTPVTTRLEARTFRELVMQDAGLLKDLDRMALEWVKRVDGKAIIVPQLPVYLRTYGKRFIANRKKEDALAAMQGMISALKGFSSQAYPRARAPDNMLLFHEDDACSEKQQQ